jgi:hypothetical protein
VAERRGEALKNVEGAIGGAVVDDDDFPLHLSGRGALSIREMQRSTTVRSL